MTEDAEYVASRTYLVTIEVEVTVGTGCDLALATESLEDRVLWTVEHVDFGGTVANVSVTDYLDTPAPNDGVTVEYDAFHLALMDQLDRLKAENAELRRLLCQDVGDGLVIQPGGLSDGPQC